MNKLTLFSVYNAVKPLPRQLLGTLEPSMVALRLLPASEGTSNRLGSDSSNRSVSWKSVSVIAKNGGNAGFAGAKTCPSDIFVGLGVVL